MATLSLAACAAPRTLELQTLAGQPVRPLEVAPGQVRVLFFVAQDCPIANSYLPSIQQLADELAGTGVECLLVHTDPDLTPRAARQHARDHALSLPIVIDARHRLVEVVAATMTPEAAVLTADGVQYLGRIDDRWRGRGQDGQVATRHDLRAAIADVRAGRCPRVAHTAVVGCHLPRLPRRPASSR